MAPRAVMSEDDVLKLVFLGWFVELYYEPITAREIMERNPEHSVTLPDFWKKPWIVIQPESILKPGRVFYIIPNHVICDLIKAYRLRNQFCSMKYYSQDLRKSSTDESGAKQSPSYRDPGCFHLRKQLSLNDVPSTTQQYVYRRVKLQSPRMSSNEMKSPRYSSNEMKSPRLSSNEMKHSPRISSSGMKHSPRIPTGQIKQSPRLSISHMKQSPRLSSSEMKQSPRFYSIEMRQSPRFSSEMNPEQQTSYRHLMQKPRSSSQAKRTDAGQDHDQFLEKELPLDSSCEEVLKHKTHDQCMKQLSPESLAWVESWLEVTSKQQPADQEFEGESPSDSWLGVRPNHTSEYDCDTGLSIDTPMRKYQVEFECFSQVQERKSCLRTQSDNGRKSDGRRVTFALPCKEKKERNDEFLQTT